MTVVERLVITFEKIGGSGNYSMIYAQYRHIYNDELEEYPEAKSKTWKATIRRTIEQHSKDSKNFFGRGDYFYHIGNERSGCWGLRSGVRYDEKSKTIIVVN